MKTTFYAAKDITVEGKVVAKKGEVALVTESNIPAERALRGIENGALTTEKPPAVSTKPAEPPAAAAQPAK
jgi:hypothetical protein